jgi:hypothetical protein
VKVKAGLSTKANHFDILSGWADRISRILMSTVNV